MDTKIKNCLGWKCFISIKLEGTLCLEYCGELIAFDKNNRRYYCIEAAGTRIKFESSQVYDIVETQGTDPKFEIILY